MMFQKLTSFWNPYQSDEQAAHEVKIKVLAHGRSEKSVFRYGLDTIQEAIKHFGDGRLEVLAAIFARCLPWKSRVLPNLNTF